MEIKRRWTPRLWAWATQSVLGGVGLILITFVCIRLGINIAAVGFAYVLLIAPLSLLGSYTASIILSIAAAGCLSYFFAPPLFDFRAASADDLLAIAAFAITSLMITALTTKLRISAAATQTSQQALRRSEAQLAAAQRLTRTGSFGWDVGSNDIVWSNEAYRIFQYDLTVKPSLELALERTHPDDVAAVGELIKSASREGKNWAIEHRLLMPDRSIKFVSIVAHALSNAPPNVEFVGAIMDVTSAKRAEAALQQAQSDLAHVNRVTTLGEMSASIAHEVSQPIAAIVTNAGAGLRWLGNETSDLDEARQALERILKDANRASEVVARIRALARKIPPRKNRLSINEVIAR